MPTVNWNREFGEPNISVDLTRILRNSFDINTGQKKLINKLVKLFMTSDNDIIYNTLKGHIIL